MYKLGFLNGKEDNGTRTKFTNTASRRPGRSLCNYVNEQRSPQAAEPQSHHPRPSLFRAQAPTHTCVGSPFFPALTWRSAPHGPVPVCKPAPTTPTPRGSRAATETQTPRGRWPGSGPIRTSAPSFRAVLGLALLPPHASACRRELSLPPVQCVWTRPTLHTSRFRLPLGGPEGRVWAAREGAR